MTPAVPLWDLSEPLVARRSGCQVLSFPTVLRGSFMSQATEVNPVKVRSEIILLGKKGTFGITGTTLPSPKKISVQLYSLA